MIPPWCSAPGALAAGLGSPRQGTWTYWRESNKASKMMKGLEHLSCKEKLRELGLLQMKRDLHNVPKYLMKGNEAEGAKLLSGAQ